MAGGRAPQRSGERTVPTSRKSASERNVESTFCYAFVPSTHATSLLGQSRRDSFSDTDCSHLATSHDGAFYGPDQSSGGHRYESDECPAHSPHHGECAGHLSALRLICTQDWLGPQVLTLFSSGRRRQRARPRSLCASYRMLQSTRPSSPAHPATHTSSSALDSPGTPSLMLPGLSSRSAAPVL